MKDPNCYPRIVLRNSTKARNDHLKKIDKDYKTLIQEGNRQARDRYGRLQKYFKDYFNISEG